MCVQVYEYYLPKMNHMTCVYQGTYQIFRAKFMIPDGAVY